MRLLARFNAWKMAALSSFVIGFAIVPNLPHFEDGLTYTAFFFQTSAGIILRVASSLILGLIGILNMIRSIEAFIHPDAIWIDDETLYWRAFGIKSLKLSEIRSVTTGPNNSIRIALKSGGRPKEFVMWVYRKDDAPEPLLSELRAAVVSG